MTKSLIALSMAALMVSACGDTWGQRAVTGGAIGAGSGAIVGGMTDIGVVPGAVIGGIAGAGIGAATAPKKRRYYYD